MNLLKNQLQPIGKALRYESHILTRIGDSQIEVLRTRKSPLIRKGRKEKEEEPIQL